MADTKTLKTRIRLKYDTYTNWITNDPVLLAGELAITTIATTPTEEVNSVAAPQVLIKVGDGTSTYSALPWASGLAADVYDWAKAATKPSYSYSEITGTPTIPTDTNTTYKIEADTTDGHKFYLKSCEKGSTTWSTVSTITIPDNNTTSFTITATATDDDVVVLTGTNGTNKVTFDAKHAKKGPSAAYTKTASTATISGSGATGTIKIPKITVDTYGHVNSAADESVTITMPTIPASLKNPNALTLQVAGTTKKTYDGSSAQTFNVTAADLGLSAAMKFLGVSSTAITDGGTEKPTISSSTVTPASGNVVLYGNKEFVWTTDSKWEELGDESSHALKTVSITGTDGLTGGGNLEASRTIAHSVPSGAAATTKGSSTTRYYIKTITTDKFGHVTGVTTGNETVTDTHYTSKNVVGTSTATANTTTALTNGNVYLNSVENGAVTSAHKISGSGAATVTTDTSGNIVITATNTDTKVTSAANHYTPTADSSSALSVDASSTTAATWNSTSLVTGVNLQRDAKGHVTGVTVDSIKMPANPNSNYTTHLYAGASGTAANSATSNGATYLKLYDNSTARESHLIKGTGATTVTSDASGNITINSAAANNAALKDGTGVTMFTANASTDIQIMVIDCGSSSDVIYTV